jgi:hypothetical protein
MVNRTFTSRNGVSPVAAIAMGLLLIAGCGGPKRHALAPVAGRVTLHGKPVANINVVFQPVASAGNQSDAGFGSCGLTGVDGRFELKTVDGKPGAVVGKHRVWLTLRDTSQPSTGPESDKPWRGPPNPLPKAAYDGTLTFDIPADGTDMACFDY